MDEALAVKTLGFPLGTKPTPDEIKKAFRARAFETHPDRGGNTDEFIQVNAAKDFLMKKFNDPYKAPYSPPPRRERPKPMEPDFVEVGQSFQQAWSANSPPASVEWKFVSIPEYYWETSNHPGHRIWTMYGQTASAHIFCSVKERGESAGFVMTGKGMTKIMEDWQVSWADDPIKSDLNRIAPKYLKSVGTGWVGLAKSPKPPRKYILWPGGQPSVALFKKIPRSGGVGLKNILVGAGLLSDTDLAVKGRKSVVQMRFEYSLDKITRRRALKGRITRSDQFEFYVIINGKKARLEDETVENLTKRFIPWALGWDNINDGITKDITKLRAGRFKGGAATALRYLADSLTNEPSWLIIALEKAAEEWEEGSKTAALYQICSEMTLAQAATVLDTTPFDLFQELVA